MSVDRDSISKAAQRIAPFIRRTPVIDVTLADIARPVTLKLELLQHSGSFKARGAFNNLAGRAASDVAAASGGNHGAAVAYAARELGHRARIFVPEISSPAKVARIASYGAEIVQRGADYNEALALCEAHIASSGALSVHAYDAEATLQGQGTLGRELQDQAPGIDTLLVAVGGGGLIAGCAAAIGAATKIVAVETDGTPTLHEALKAGRPVDVKISGIAADALGASRIGTPNFEVAQKLVRQSLLVSDDAVRAAQRALWEELRVVAEPAGATGLAALMSGAYTPAVGERVATLVCGANTDPGSVA